MNNYALNTSASGAEKISVFASVRQLMPFLKQETSAMIGAACAMFINVGLTLLAPFLIGYTIDTYIQTKQVHGVFVFTAILFLMSLVALVANYLQTMFMGTVGQQMLFQLRQAIFMKLQSLPVAFFHQNQVGDLISRINNDTDKLNQFFSRSLIQFVSNGLTIVGAGVAIIIINWRLGLAALVPAAGILIFTQLISGWMRRVNAKNLQTTGGLSAEISESLAQFKVIVAFHRRDYFRKRFQEANEINYRSSILAGIANNTLTPIYSLASSLAQLIVVGYGISLILAGHCTVGVLISFLAYLTRFYDPLRQMATVWSDFQVALAGSDRIQSILSLESDLPLIDRKETLVASSPLIEFQHVSFHYPDGKEVLKHINFTLQSGKTYALVGPTGGGKTTTASLMARLYDPSEGIVRFHGRDLRSISLEERTQKIGFILQDPFLFTGTIRENILYGNTQYKQVTAEELENVIHAKGLETLLARFDMGLDTPVSINGGSLSLGQKQLIAFMRTLLRDPDVLILDEATANIDTVTEQLLEDILSKLPASTTKVIIAHRLNTIENADEIFFVSGAEVTRAGSMQQALDLLLHGGRKNS